MKIRQITPIIFCFFTITLPVIAMQKQTYKPCWVEDNKKCPDPISRIIARQSQILGDELERPRVLYRVCQSSRKSPINDEVPRNRAFSESDLITLLPYKWVAIQIPLSVKQLALNQLYQNLTLPQALFVKELYNRLSKGKIPQLSDHGKMVWKSISTELQNIIKTKVGVQRKPITDNNNE